MDCPPHILVPAIFQALFPSPLLCCLGLGQLLVWEWQSETYVLKQQGHGDALNTLAYSPDGQVRGQPLHPFKAPEMETMLFTCPLSPMLGPPPLCLPPLPSLFLPPLLPLFYHAADRDGRRGQQGEALVHVLRLLARDV